MVEVEEEEEEEEEEEDYIIACNILPPPHSLLLPHIYKHKHKQYNITIITYCTFVSFSESNQCWLSNLHVFLKGENDKGVKCAQRPYDTGQSAVRVRPMGIGPCTGHCCGRTQASGARGLRVACKG